MSTAHAATPHVYTAIIAVMAHLSEVGISKDRKNEQQGYKFRGIDDVYNALAGTLSKNHLCILPRVKTREVVERQTARGTSLFYVNVDVDFDFVSALDGSKHIVSVSAEAMDSADKATNKAMSAAFKYACLQAFCIPTEGDNDADSTTHDVKPKAAIRKDTPPQDDPEPAALVGATDVSTITALAAEAEVDLALICKSVGITSIDAMPMHHLQTVIGKLQSKIKTKEQA